MMTALTRSMAYLLLVISLIAYILPWLTNPPAGLTFAAYDLAEWTSLHPTVRDSTPPLLISLLLRISLPCLMLGVLFTIKEQPRWASFLITILISAAMLPPFEFLTQYHGDPNYQQQFAIAVTTLIIGIVATTQWFQHLHSIASLMLLAVSSVSTLVGIAQARELMNVFGLPGKLGIGSVLHNAAALAATVLMISHRLANKTGQPHHATAPSNASG